MSFRSRIIAVALSLCVGSLLMGAKFIAYYLTGSSAIFSDAMESIINVVASAFAAVSIVMASRPPDESHPYGHGKIEFFSAGFEGALIILAAAGIFRMGIARLISPQPLPNLESGLWIVLGASLANLLLGTLLIRIGRRTQSLTLIADGKHVLTDVYTSAAVLIGLVLVPLTGWLRIDGAVACLMGINILVVGIRLAREAFAGLMDESDPQLIAEVSDLLVLNRRDLWIDIHQLRAWKAGSLIHIDLHVVLPKDLSLDRSHQEAKSLEALVTGHFRGNASVLVHMDPCTDPDCPACRRFRCDHRNAQWNGRDGWSEKPLTVMRKDHRGDTKSMEANPSAGSGQQGRESPPR